MNNFPNHEEIENRLLDEMSAAHARYRAGECSAAEFQITLKRWNDFVVEGTIPEDLTEPQSLKVA